MESKSNDVADKQPAPSSRSNEISDPIIESARIETNLRLDSPHPDSELSYSQQIKEQDKTVSNAESKSLEPNERATNKSLEPQKSGEIVVSKPSRLVVQSAEDEAEVKEKRNLLKKLTANLAQSASRKSNHLSSVSKRRNMARYKRRCSGRLDGADSTKRTPSARCRHDRSTTPDSDDELSNNQFDFPASFRRKDAGKSADQRNGRDFTFKHSLLGEPNAKNKKKKLADLELANRALIKNNTFKFSDCNISLHFC